LGTTNTANAEANLTFDGSTLTVTGNISSTGNITANTLVVQTVSSSVIYSSGSNVFGDSVVDNHEFTGSVKITGSFTVTGPATINSLTGSLFGTASWAQNAVSSSFPITVTGTTLRSVSPAAGTNNSVTNSIFLGTSAGASSTNASSSNFFGNSAGGNSTNADNSNFFGYSAGSNAANANNSNFFGYIAGGGATNASNSNIFGYRAGFFARSASFSTLIGYRVGDNVATDAASSIKSNNIIIGTNITLNSGRQDSINLGGLIFGTGSYSTTTGNPFSGSANGRIGINQPNPQFSLDVSGSGNFTNGLSVSGSFDLGLAEFNTTSSAPAVGGYQVIASQLTGSYRAAFFDYVAYSGSIARAGTLYSTWGGGSIEWFENYTADVNGSTSGIILQAALTSNSVQLQASASNTLWTIKSLVRLL
jgi:hypothetical protein